MTENMHADDGTMLCAVLPYIIPCKNYDYNYVAYTEKHMEN